MEEEKVKVVFEFDKKDYEHYLFLMDQKLNEETEMVWKAMTNEDIAVNGESISKMFGLSQKDSLTMFVAMAIMGVKGKV